MNTVVDMLCVCVCVCCLLLRHPLCSTLHRVEGDRWGMKVFHVTANGSSVGSNVPG